MGWQSGFAQSVTPHNMRFSRRRSAALRGAAEARSECTRVLALSVLRSMTGKQSL